MRAPRWIGVLVLAIGLAVRGVAWAQGGGASQTGTITGRVVDPTGAVLPGVTVTAVSRSLMGVQTSVTNESGVYRFPALPSGVYTLTFELPGFTTLKREGIEISVGFTATVNVELRMASLEESVTVSGESPVIDTSATRVTQNFKAEQLQSIPNARDMWSLLAITPSVVMSRIDVGGNRAGTQTGYEAYGISGQVRVLVEGINTTEGTGGAGFYFDYGSFEEVYIGTAGQGAEMPHPGVMSQFVGKSGGNNFQGNVYLDWYNNSLQASNLPEEYIARGIRKGGNEMQKYYDFNLNLGGPIRKDKVWWYFSYRDQKNAVNVVNFRFDKTFDTRLWNPSGKVTYLLNPNNKFIGYYQWGQKIQPNRVDRGGIHLDPDSTTKQNSGSWVWKGEWNGTISNNLYVEVRYGDFGYYFPRLGYSNEPFRFDTGTRIIEGGDFWWQQDRDRKQLTGSATYFKDGWGGSHNFKIGGEVNLETQWNGYERTAAGNIEHYLFNGASRTVVFGFPTAEGPLGKYSSRKDMLMIAKLDHLSAFLSDQWGLGDRLTLTLGVRYDHYKSHIPQQKQLAWTTGPFSIPAQTFDARTFFTWDSVAPRVGVIYDLTGRGTTVAKINYGYFTHNPGPGIAASANPNQAYKAVTYEWFDRNGDRLWQPGEEGALVSTALAGTITIDPNIQKPFTHEVSAFLERQLIPDLGVRAGFVYKTVDDDWFSLQPGRPFSAYTVPFTAVDIGVDGVAGTADDRTLTFYGLPRAQLASLPANTVIGTTTTAFARHKTVEVSMNKRMSRGWSANAGFGYTWTYDSPNRNNPNVRGAEHSSRWSFKASAIYSGPWGLLIAPVLRHQAGVNFARTISVSAPVASGAFFSGTVNVEPISANRAPNITVVDVRVEKAVELGGSTRVRGFLDLFNVRNSHTPESINTSTGPNYLVPLQVLAPFTARVGFRFEW